MELGDPIPDLLRVEAQGGPEPITRDLAASGTLMDPTLRDAKELAQVFNGPEARRITRPTGRRRYQFGRALPRLAHHDRLGVSDVARTDSGTL